MKRKVLVLNHFAVLRGSAGGTRHVELFSRLEGWDACILAADRNVQTRKRESHRERGFRTVPTTPFSGSYPSRVVNWTSYAFSAFSAGLLRREAPNIVYGSSPHLLTGLAAWAIARLRKARFIFEVRDIWPLVLVEMETLRTSSPIYKGLEFLERFLYRRADRIVILAEGTAGRLAECGVPPARVSFIPNGAEPSDFLPTISRDEARARLRVSGFVFVYAGAHGEANGLDLLIDAAAQSQDELPDVTFLLLGDGPSKPDLVRRAEVENLSNVLFRDSVPKDALADIFSGCDAGIHVLADVPLFRYGVSPNKLYDYMAAGLPVLTNTPGEVSQLVSQAKSGVAVEPNGLMEGVRRVRAANETERHEWSESGRVFMEEHRSRTVLAKQLESLLNEVAS
jgi:glycosyltransferase involved in cell wall biosynthesis